MRPADSFIAQPIRSLQTMLRIIAKDDPRLPLVIPDGIYGPSTTNAVAAFQRIYGMPVTGIADENTWNKVVSVYEPAMIRIDKAAPIEILLEPRQVITIGDSGPNIYLLQGMLAYLSVNNSLIPPPTNSGIFDEETSASVLSFQKIAALENTGEVDRITWLYLVNLFTLSAHYQNKTR